MDWLWYAFWAKIGWTLGGFIFSAGILLCVIIFLLLRSVLASLRQYRCEHPSVFETQSCQAVCNACGKHLGFIGTWREKHERGM